MDWAAGLFPGFFPDVAVRRTRIPVRRTSPSTRHGETTERPADVPLGDGDSDRDVAPSRSGWLSSRSRRQRRYDFTAGRRFRFRFVPRTVRHSLLLLPTTATSSSADVPWLPVSSGKPTQHSAFSWQQFLAGTAVPSNQRRQHSRCEATLRHTESRRLSAITQRTLSSPNTTRLFTRLPHATKHVRSRARTPTNCRLLRNFFASPLKHVLLT